MYAQWAFLAALVAWACLTFLFRTTSRRTSRETLEKSAIFSLAAAPWSDPHVETLLARYPTSPAVLAQYVANAGNRGEHDERLRRAELFCKRRPDLAQAWVTRLYALRAVGRTAESDALLRRLRWRRPFDPEIALAWARMARQQSGIPELVARMRRVRRRYPNRQEPWLEAAAALLELGRVQESTQIIEVALSRWPESWELWKLSGNLHDISGNPQVAATHWAEIRARFPEQPASFVSHAAALTRAGQADEATALLQQARDYFPGDKQVAAALEQKQQQPPN